MISEGPNPIEPLPTRLQDALRAELTAGETLVVSVRGGTGAALAATERRLITLFEPGPLEAGQPVRLQSYAWESVREFSLEERLSGGRLTWRVNGDTAAFEFPSYDSAKFRRVLERLRKLVPAAGTASPSAPPRSDARTAMEEKPCPRCGSALPEMAAFCPVCGLQVLDICWECGEPLKGDWAYCRRCGTSAAETGVVPCPSCREPVGRARRYCTHCGAEARPLCEQCGETMRREWRFCPECGTPAGDETGTRSREEFGARGAESATSAAPARPRAPKSAPDGTAAALNARGMEAYEADRFDEAIDLFRQAVALEPESADYRTNLAVALDENDRDEEAMAEYQRAIELEPRHTTALLNLGYLYSERERYTEARELWEQVIRVDARSQEAEDAREALQHLDEL